MNRTETTAVSLNTHSTYMYIR